MLHTLSPLHRMMRSHMVSFRGWLPLFYIWGAQWMLNGTAKWYAGWKLPGWFQPATALAAAIASIAILLASSSVRPSGDALPPGFRLASLYAAVPFGIATGSLLLLEYVQAIDPFFMVLFRSLLLSVFMACLGVLLGLELMLLGIWMFFLCTVTCVWYLGFAPMVLEFMGGLGLLACGLIVGLWTRKAGPSPSL